MVEDGGRAASPDGARRAGRRGGGRGIAWSLGILVILILAGCAAVFVVAPKIRADRIESLAADVRGDLDFLERAVEAYLVDAGEYPTDLLPHLTTPSAYLTNEPLDPFTPAGIGRYRYARSADGEDWAIWSAGPDGAPDLEGARLLFTRTSSTERALRKVTWDPTNGAVSAGDIWLRRRLP